MEIQFDLGGDPTGGRITNYLLEKSRVVYQANGERNFHSFYLLLAGADDGLKREFSLRRPDDYHYTKQGNASFIDGFDDKANFQDVVHAMEVMKLTPKEQKEVWQIVSAILTIGNIGFVQNDKDEAQVSDAKEMQLAAKLIGVTPDELEHVLTHHTISTGTAGRSARVSTYASPHNAASAEYARDALAKAMYSRLFDWIVMRVNKAMGWRTGEGYITLSLLDIYGFEIFGINSFEQLCINFVNEKLQQIFIELTLKAEQEEYKAEGIQWEDVDYFNNKICCDLIESTRPAGLFRILDDVCTMPGGSDAKFLQQAAETHAGHAHFIPYPQENRFDIRHYAGDVQYSVDGCLDKNRDTFYYDHSDLCGNSQNSVLASLFPESAIVQGDRDKKRPSTAGFKIKQSIADLVIELGKCKMHYIRCIKPNDTKSALNFDATRVMHQVQYLGLLENTRIRRAGYAFRETYEKFFYRFRVCCHETWPNWNGPGGFEGGSEAIIRSVVTAGDKQPYAKGKTKIFIRMPETVFALEELRDRTVQSYANRLQRFFLQFTLQNYYYNLHKNVNEKLLGKKERRPASIQLDSASFHGDYLNYRDNFALKALLQAYGHEKVTFSHAVNKYYAILGPLYITRCQRRMLLLTDQAFYLVSISGNPDKEARKRKPFIYEIRRRSELKELSGVSLSSYKDGYVVLHAPPADVLIEVRRKTEFLAMLLKQIPALNINFNNKIPMRDKGGKTHFVSFEKNPQGGAGTMKSMKVIVEEGLPASSQPNIKPPANIALVTSGDYYQTREKAQARARPTPGQQPGTSGAQAHGQSPSNSRALPGSPASRGRALPTPSSRGRAASPSTGRANPPPSGRSSATPGGRGRGTAATTTNAAGRGTNPAGRGGAGRATTAPAGRGSAGRGANQAGRGSGAPAGRGSGAPPGGVKKGKVLYDFKSENPEEIDITEGGIVTITRKMGDWLEGDFNGKHGLFPTAYVEEMK